MNDTDALERAFQRIRELPPEERERFRAVLDDMLEQDTLARDMEDPEYRAYVEQALEESAADVAAGRTYTVDEVRRHLDEVAKRLDG